ncbi:flavin-dependent oxidoreductase [Nitrosospira multiformis]|uniref:Flavin-dependent oxidoreductase n=1 Tax=Nitrosospira multiformis TaxID=1231 RepID=A0A2T5IGU8_9PROT|nr:FAD-dependent oxidoreductase [Nitrosospira multiformis]PTQ83031.1 flavin-dependent oxidoreductase [Nitrosospira multiformis]
MRDTAFKRVLKKIPLGTEFKMEGPGGSFTLHNNKAIPAVFLAGGIGITPVRSIVLQAIHDQVARDLFVFDSNNRPEDAAFLDDLEQLQHGAIRDVLRAGGCSPNLAEARRLGFH